MRWDIREKSLPVMRLQRNIAGAFAGIMLVCNLLLATLFMFMDQIVIVVPHHFSQEVSLKGSKPSQSYVEEWASYYTFLLLTVSPKTFSYQKGKVLKSVVPQYYGALSQRLLERGEMIKRQNLSTVFHPTKFSIEGMSATVTGILDSYIGDKRIKSSKKTYRLKFVFHAGRLFIEEFMEV